MYGYGDIKRQTELMLHQQIQHYVYRNINNIITHLHIRREVITDYMVKRRNELCIYRNISPYQRLYISYSKYKHSSIVVILLHEIFVSMIYMYVQIGTYVIRTIYVSLSVMLCTGGGHAKLNAINLLHIAYKKHFSRAT